MFEDLKPDDQPERYRRAVECRTAHNAAVARRFRALDLFRVGYVNDIDMGADLDAARAKIREIDAVTAKLESLAVEEAPPEVESIPTRMQQLELPL
jgi:hypothetical protein